MVKHILQKRTSKKMTVEEHKQLEESRKIRKKEVPNKKYFIDISRRHKFKRQSDKVKEIDISIAHKIEEIKILPYSFDRDQIGILFFSNPLFSNRFLGSFFYDELENLRYLERSKEFLQFYHEVIDVSQTLPLILHNMNKIVGSMLKRLGSKNLNAIILKLFAPLIRDCQSEIFPIFCQDILMKLLSMIDIKNIDILEDIFMVLAYALKYLFQKIMKEFKSFFDIYFFQLFGHRNKHIRKFAAESFSYIFKKTPKNELQNKLTIILDSVCELDYTEFQNNFDCLAELMFESIRMTQNSVNLSYRFTEVYQAFWELLAAKYSNNNNVLMIFFKFIQNVIRKISNENKDQSNMIKTYNLVDFFALVNENFHFGTSDLICQFILKIFLFNVTFIQGRKATAKILDSNLECVLKINYEQNKSLERMVFILLGKICKYRHSELSLNSIEKIERILLAKTEEKNSAAYFLLALIFNDVFDENANRNNSEDFQEEEIEILEKKYNINKKVYEYCVILILTKFKFNEIAERKCETIDLLKYYMFWMLHKFNNNDKLIAIKNTEVITKADIANIERNFSNLITNLCKTREITSYDFLYVLTVLKLSKILDFNEVIRDDLLKILGKINGLIDDYFEKQDWKFDHKKYDVAPKNSADSFINDEFSDEFLEFYKFEEISHDLSKIPFETILITFKTEISKCFMNKLNVEYIVKSQQKMAYAAHTLQKEFRYLKPFRKNLGFLKYLNDLLHCYFDQLKIKKIDPSSLVNEIVCKEGNFFLKFQENYETFQILISNLCSNYSEIRLYSLQILKIFEPLNFEENSENTKESIFHGECELIPLLLQVFIYFCCF